MAWDCPRGFEQYRDVILRLGPTRPAGDGLAFQCLFPERHKHGDRNWSAFVCLTPDKGNLSAFCRGCGAKWPEIVAATGTKPQDWFPDRGESWSRDRKRRLAMGPKPVLVATYIYRDRAGEYLYEKQRWEPGYEGRDKTFRFRRPLPAQYRAGSGLADGVESFVYTIQGDEVIRPQGRSDYYPKRNGLEGHSIVIEPCPPVLYRWPELVTADPRAPVLVCYSPDTEVLTPGGWVVFPDLDISHRVAQYDLTNGSISFAYPSQRQVFEYAGEIVHIQADWCDLMVTPDHRQPVKHQRCNPKIVTANEVKRSLSLPTAGYMEGGSGPSVEWARLIVAWLADGVDEKRGDQVSWNLKKERKKVRIRELFRACGVVWSEHEYKSTPGWTSFRVYKEEMERAFCWCNGKSWHWHTLSWTSEAREAALVELGYWDGDSQTDKSVRFFTGCRKSADVVCALAAVTGWSASLRVDARPGKNDSFVVNLNRKSWKALGSDPVRVPYSGQVYCCTVPTGLLVVRRNGKVTISGNCEGEKDVDLLRDAGFVAVCGCQASSNWLDGWSENLRGRRVCIIPDHNHVGYKHADAVAGSLLRHGVASLRVVMWDGTEEEYYYPGEGGGVGNWPAFTVTGDQTTRRAIVTELCKRATEYARPKLEAAA